MAFPTFGILRDSVASGVPSPAMASGRARDFWSPGSWHLMFQVLQWPLVGQVASAGVVGPDMEEVLLGKARQVLRSVGRLVGRVLLWVLGKSVFSCRAGGFC